MIHTQELAHNKIGSGNFMYLFGTKLLLEPMLT